MTWRSITFKYVTYYKDASSCNINLTQHSHSYQQMINNNFSLLTMWQKLANHCVSNFESHATILTRPTFSWLSSFLNKASCKMKVQTLSQNLYVWRCPCDWKVKRKRRKLRRKNRWIITFITYEDLSFSRTHIFANLNHICSIDHKMSRCQRCCWLLSGVWPPTSCLRITTAKHTSNMK